MDKRRGMSSSKMVSWHPTYSSRLGKMCRMGKDDEFAEWNRMNFATTLVDFQGYLLLNIMKSGFIRPC